MSTRQPPTAQLEQVQSSAVDRLNLQPQLIQTLGIINATHRDLVVVTRSGLKFTIRSHTGHGERAVYFRQSFRTHTSARVDINPRLAPSLTTEPSTAERLYNAMRDKFDNSPQLGSSSSKETTLLNRLTLESILQAGGAVYIAELDVVISAMSSQVIVHHPLSAEGACEQLRPLDTDPVSLRYELFIVDNRKFYGPRYTNIHEQVFQVPVRNRPSMEDGVYVCHPMPSTAGGVLTEYLPQHMTMEEAEGKYHLYRTIEEAFTYGFSKEALDRENLTRRRASEERKEQNEEIKYEREETAAERRERMEHEKESRQRREDAKQEREAIRRDIVDILKFVSAIVIAVTGFCATFIKLKQSK